MQAYHQLKQSSVGNKNCTTFFLFLLEYVCSKIRSSEADVDMDFDEIFVLTAHTIETMKTIITVFVTDRGITRNAALSQ